VTLAGNAGLLATAWAMGFLGSTHCIGMCGGISAALSFALPPSARTGWLLPAYQLLYNSGRIGTYTLLGGLLGWLGNSLLMGWAGTLWPRELAALVMIVLGLYLAGWWKGLQQLERFGDGVWQHLQPLSKRLLPVDNPGKAIAAGAVWGFLPCGLVYSGLGVALTAADPAASALVMLAFGLGTLPTVLVTGSLASGLRRFMQAPSTRRIAGATVVGFGLWTGGIAWYHHQMQLGGPMADMPGMAPRSAPILPAQAAAKHAGTEAANDMAGMDMSGMDMDDTAHTQR
jgi:sulfite exporter TauE/SafE